MKNPKRAAELIAELKSLAENQFESHRIEVLERDLQSPPVVEVIDDTHQKFDGVVYRKKKDNHFGNGHQIHRIVYAYHYGEIPDSYVVHHVDGNPANNAIENLKLMSLAEHGKHHNFPKVIQKFICAYCGKEYEAVANNNPQTGNKFCSAKCCEHFHNRLPKVTKKCVVCGKSFETTFNGVKKYCSEICRRKSANVRHAETRACEWCGKKFSINRYRKTKYCSHTCHMKARHEENRNVKS